jgi:hypothetical protein
MATVFRFPEGLPVDFWERCSLRSFNDFGHELTLFSYSNVRPESPSKIALTAAISDPPSIKRVAGWWRVLAHAPG